MNEDRPWLGDEPSGRPDPSFRPLPTAIAVFTAVATPIVVYGLTRATGPNAVLIALGVFAGVLAGVAAGLAIDRYGGDPPRRGPRL